jgi:hypothetical protein
MPHQIIHYDNGDQGWIELDCDKSCDTQDLINFDLIDWLDAADNNFQMKCPDCGSVALVENTTP